MGKVAAPDPRTTWGRILAKAEGEVLAQDRASAASQAPFRFDRAASSALGTLLGSDGAVADLERLVSSYRRDPELDVLALPRDLRRRLEAAQGHIDGLKRALSRLPKRLDYFYRDYPVPEALRRLDLEIKQLLRWNRKPGKKRPGERARLLSGFGRVLAKHGIRVSLTRAGRVEKAYRIVHLAATGERMGDDLLRTILRPLGIAAGMRRN